MQRSATPRPRAHAGFVSGIRRLRLLRALAGVMGLVIPLVTMPMAPVHAVMISTEQALEQAMEPDARTRLDAFLARADVRQQLVELGVDPAEAMARVDALSDREVQQIAGQLEVLPAGEGAIGTVVGAAVLIFFVLLLTDLLGLTDVYPFVRK